MIRLCVCVFGAMIRRVCADTEADHHAVRSSLQPPDDVEPSVEAGPLTRHVRPETTTAELLIGGMKYCRGKLKGPNVKIIHDLHISLA